MSNRRSAAVPLLALVPLGAALLRAQGAPHAPPTVGSTYTNIQVFTDLKDAPPPRLIDAMQFMAGSLGVSCDYCHVSQHGPFDSDANHKKVIAREMIRMVRALNAATFDGRQAVTCYTCHQGTTRPKTIPTPWYKTAEEVAAYKASVAGQHGPASTTAMPDVDQIFDRYRRAAGAAKLTSVRLVGVNAVAMSDASTPFEADAVLPDRFLLETKNPGGGVQNILNGRNGWRRAGQSTAPLPPAQLAALRANADVLVNPVKFETSSDPRKVTGVEQIGGKRYYVIETALPDGPQRLYFDAASGLLYKVHTETKTALGNRVEERTFEDYRTVDGVTLPFLIRNHYMEDQSEFRISSAEVNVALDARLFEAAAPPVRLTPREQLK